MSIKLPRIKLLTMLLLLIGLTGWLLDGFNFLQEPLIPNDKTVDYVIEPGSSIATVAADLHNMGFLKHRYYLIILAIVKGYQHRLKAGEYVFPAGTRPLQLLQQIVQGKVIYHSLTLVEGWTFEQDLYAIKHNPYLKHTLLGLNTSQIMQRLGYGGEYPEGRFFPDTYRFHAGITDVTFLQRAYRTMAHQLQQQWQMRAVGVPYKDAESALIVASMIEKESARPEERPIIANVIISRLKKNMPLQIDATIIYGLGGQYMGKLTKADMHLDTPYNSYLHKGLPPTPIAMPSLSAIVAALHPQASDALYFVAKGDGSHQFSITLHEQDIAIEKYELNANLNKTLGQTTNAISQRYLVILLHLKQTACKPCLPAWYTQKLLPILMPLFITKHSSIEEFKCPLNN